jgi:Arc/MetJ-type ribon-helix-helix transcriptional regulator
MIILYQSTPNVKRILDELLETGKYKDYSEIISLAVMNLAVLQKEIEESGEMFIEDTSHGEEFISSSKKPQLKTLQSFQSIKEGKEQHFSRNLSLFKSINAIEPPYEPLRIKETNQPPREVPVDQWIFGQHNRLLPVKVSCRALANLMLTEPQGISLSKFSNKIANSAAELAKSLRKIDKKFNNKHDDALSTAFPADGKRKHKSIERYISQFIAQMTREGKLTGLLADLKLITKANSTGDFIQLTQPGWDFAVLPNQILDGTDSEPPKNLSAEEKEFLITHIYDKVPVERAAYSAILECILSGLNSPTLIDEVMKAGVTKDKLESVSKAFLSTQRSGAISRMADLGLVERNRDGVYVKYIVTPASELFIRRDKSNKE